MVQMVMVADVDGGAVGDSGADGDVDGGADGDGADGDGG